MALLNYTTSIEAMKTVNEIQRTLANHGAKAVLINYDDEGHIMATGSGWDTTASDDPNTKYIIPYLTHPKSPDKFPPGEDVFVSESGRANPHVIEQNIELFSVEETIRRNSW